MKRPHVLILGAGASKASCPEDKNGKKLPVMKDFSEVIGLTQILTDWGINPHRNFEEIFSDLYDTGQGQKIIELECIVKEYFQQLQLPNFPTIYDHLILSLCEADLIATFNWDPFLMQAYHRNRNSGLSLPKLAFLHGSINVGYCKNDNTYGLVGGSCGKCFEKIDQNVPLLYPIKQKNYSENFFISCQWNLLKRKLKEAFMITIFGYGAPKSDQEAISTLKMVWGDAYERNMEQIAFISIDNEEKILDSWKNFIHSHHFELHSDFYNSWIANHPRGTREAYLAQYYNHEYLRDNPIPRNLDFSESWDWFTQCEGGFKEFSGITVGNSNMLDFNKKLLENEVILLKNVYDHIDNMLNPSIVEIQGKDPRCNVMFHDDNCKKIFYILLNDFLSETDSQAPIDKTTFLNGLLKIGNNPQFSVKHSERELKASVEAFSAWLGGEKEINVWMPSISKDVKISISRIDAIKICGNLSKHNDLRAFGVVKKFKEIMNKSGLIIADKEHMTALKDFYDRLQDDILIYLSSYICEFLNNIRLAMHSYLLPEFNRSYYELDSEIPPYSYKVPKEIECGYARDCYWELMNILGRRPLMRKFVISSSFKSEY